MSVNDERHLPRARAAEAIRQIRAEIGRSRTAGTVEMEASIERSLEQLRRRATISAHWGIVPTWPVLGGVEVLGKRALRILLRWYINPIVEQQNHFNMAVLAAIHELEAQLHSIPSDKSPDRGLMERDASR